MSIKVKLDSIRLCELRMVGKEELQTDRVFADLKVYPQFSVDSEAAERILLFAFDRIPAPPDIVLVGGLDAPPFDMAGFEESPRAAFANLDLPLGSADLHAVQPVLQSFRIDKVETAIRPRGFGLSWGTRRSAGFSSQSLPTFDRTFSAPFGRDDVAVGISGSTTDRYIPFRSGVKSALIWGDQCFRADNESISLAVASQFRSGHSATKGLDANARAGGVFISPVLRRHFCISRNAPDVPCDAVREIMRQAVLVFATYIAAQVADGLAVELGHSI